MRVKIGNTYWSQGYTMNGETVPVKAKLVKLVDWRWHGYDCLTESSDGIRMYSHTSELRETKGEVWADIKRENLETEEATNE